jgi:hypothetical protein
VAGKGDTRRPQRVSEREMEARWRATFDVPDDHGRSVAWYLRQDQRRAQEERDREEWQRRYAQAFDQVWGEGPCDRGPGSGSARSSVGRARTRVPPPPPDGKPPAACSCTRGGPDSAACSCRDR